MTFRTSIHLTAGITLLLLAAFLAYRSPSVSVNSSARQPAHIPASRPARTSTQDTSSAQPSTGSVAAGNPHPFRGSIDRRPSRLLGSSRSLDERTAASSPSRHRPALAGYSSGPFRQTAAGSTPVIPADPSATGNQLVAHDLLVEVTGSETTPEGISLHVELSDLPAPRPPTFDWSKGNGFTIEEELFRAKWGWEAYDRVQRAAFQAASLPR